jgi:hypothetical protein
MMALPMAALPKVMPKKASSIRSGRENRSDLSTSWQAAEKAGSLAFPAMIASLREHQFDTVLGPIDFDDKGDLTVQKPVWWVWRNGTYAPLEQTKDQE